mmetsp:Transcript_4134/g.5931  ORF Transcript_4134/g.5931 Transcript_4134/m.5931 type:complete len:80 (+) Transcript_4134:230-469(+)
MGQRKYFQQIFKATMATTAMKNCDSTSGTQYPMDIESDIGANHNYICNRVCGKKNFIIGAVMAFALILMPLIVTTSHKG